MYRILKKQKLADKIWLMDVQADRIARKCLPGEFLIVKIDSQGERIPLTICDYNRETGVVTIVFQEVGASTYRMAAELNEGDAFQDVVGPLGRASELTEKDPEELKKMNILFVAGGVGAAPVYPQVKWLKEQGVAADVVQGSKNKDLVILEEEMKAVAGDHLYITTDDGSQMDIARIIYQGHQAAIVDVNLDGWADALMMDEDGSGDISEEEFHPLGADTRIEMAPLAQAANYQPEDGDELGNDLPTAFVGTEPDIDTPPAEEEGDVATTNLGNDEEIGFDTYGESGTMGSDDILADNSTTVSDGTDDLILV